MIRQIKAWLVAVLASHQRGAQRLRQSVFYSYSDRQYYYVGDPAPDSLLNHKASDGNLGAIISIDPQTKIITSIVIP